ncbi:MAG: septum site-determining protein MinC [Pseudomonadota bacterium]
MKEPDTPSVTTVKPFQIRGRFFTAVALRLTGRPDPAFFAALDTQLQQTPRFFDNAPFVIDLEQAGAEVEPGELGRLIDELRQRRLSLFGIQNASVEQTNLARDAGLISLPSGREVSVDRVERENTPAETKDSAAGSPEPAAKEPAPQAARIITEPVRSGQTVFADAGDLVVVASVSSGAELVAAGSIHIYGALRGRALAGVNGDTKARIFCRKLDAELIAVAGLYRTNDDLEPESRNRNVQVFLRDEKLLVEPLT